MSWIEGEIARLGGAVRFDRFMELALYHPQHGYYAAGRRRVGREGDFLTAPTASSWYAAVLARLLRGLAEQLGPVVMVDLGSNDGRLLADLLDALGGEAPATLGRVVSVERSPSARALQEVRFGAGPVPVSVVSELEPVVRAAGPTLLHASELYDALPVRRVVQREGGLEELWVATGEGGLEWRGRPAPVELEAYFAGHGVTLEPGQLAEANLAAAPVHARHLGWAGPLGVALTLDYGYPARRLYDPRGRRGGSLACYRGHRLGRDPLASPGEWDLTAHVNWDDLRRAGAAVGFGEVGTWGLGELLLRAGLPAELDARGAGEEAELCAEVYARRQEVKRLLDPDGMGSDLKALVQATPAVAGAVSGLLGTNDA